MSMPSVSLTRSLTFWAQPAHPPLFWLDLVTHLISFVNGPVFFVACNCDPSQKSCERKFIYFTRLLRWLVTAFSFTWYFVAAITGQLVTCLKSLVTGFSNFHKTFETGHFLAQVMMVRVRIPFSHNSPVKCAWVLSKRFLANKSHHQDYRGVCW